MSRIKFRMHAWFTDTFTQFYETTGVSAKHMRACKYRYDFQAVFEFFLIFF